MGWRGRAAALLVLAGGCVDTGEDAGDPVPETVLAEARSLVDHAAWAPLDPSDDPLAGHRPDGADCPVGGWYAEGRGVEVDTGRCAYLGLVQPSLAPVAVGDRLHVFAFHNGLTAPEPAEAHAAVLLGGSVLWETTLPIPSPATPLEAQLEAPVAAPVGAPVQLHLHNHGANTWTWVTLEVAPGG
ncbi:MAG: hypothetical protein H6732_14435 [Alphaproteobacteria bacterium]|nr:hypothetical protein [Alphaproteobacteria bacterium]